MKKFGFIMALCVFLVATLVVFTFIYIDTSGHKNFTYNVFLNGNKIGDTVIDRFLTEEKVIYKGTTNFFRTTGYPLVAEKLYLDRQTKYPIKFEQESEGINKCKRTVLLAQNGESSDFLYMEYPQFFTSEAFPTGSKTSVFLPEDIMLYMPIMDKYNYWKKGAQFFEIMMPLPERLPPMRDKMGVKFVEESFAPVLGKRMEAYKFLVQAGCLHDIEVIVEKHTHVILSINIDRTGFRCELAEYEFTPAKKFFSRIKEAVLKGTGRALLGNQERDGAGDVVRDQPSVEEAGAKEERFEQIFFQGSGGTLSGQLYLPEGPGGFPAVLFVQRDGAQTGGEQLLSSALGRDLRTNNIVFMRFNDVSNSKGNGELCASAGKERIKDIDAAVDFLASNAKVDPEQIYLLGYKTGGAVALEAASENRNVTGSILLGVPQFAPFQDLSHENVEVLVQKMITKQGLRKFDDGFLKNVQNEILKHKLSSGESDQDFVFFLGRKVPVKSSLSLMNRQVFSILISAEKPVLFIFSKDEYEFDAKKISWVKNSFASDSDLYMLHETKPAGEYFGQIVGSGTEWAFKVSADVLSVIRQWILDRPYNK